MRVAWPNHCVMTLLYLFLGVVAISPVARG